MTAMELKWSITNKIVILSCATKRTSQAQVFYRRGNPTFTATEVSLSTKPHNTSYKHSFFDYFHTA